MCAAKVEGGILTNDISVLDLKEWFSVVVLSKVKPLLTIPKIVLLFFRDIAFVSLSFKNLNLGFILLIVPTVK